MCDKLHLNSVTPNQLTHAFPNWPQALAQPKFPANHVIKTGRVDINKCVPTMNDRALSRLLGASHAHVTFPEARALYINIPNACEPSPFRDMDRAVAVQNIGVFTKTEANVAGYPNSQHIVE
ncbi:hypothetical protein BX661DRAFT_168067 [Kickxella alabastrina]|uniref:uncharacterized protein n=1 Tax=Kickxella alabastrina TaxID=61397 RepID=UPI00221F10E9|nr:uncharacterized protein BX661DRAFT_168067 [Kickxella alabastrina]KAI7834871.1 hypothetical protein BX661DRAFT_168067 [Kickxella alabastrina]